MLDLGFLPDVEQLLSKTPETRQTMLFSATMPAAIVALARTHMRHPMNIRAESSYENATVPATAQFIYQVHDLDKPEIIGRVLQAEDAGKMIVFTRTKRQAQRVADDLAERGFKASPLHGDMAQVAREKALTRFREDKIQVLVVHRRRRPRHRRAGRLPRHQLLLPRGRQDLHPPDRPHRPRRRHRHRDHLRRLGRPAPLEDDQQGARPAVRRAAGDLLDLRAPLPRPGHPARHQGPHRRPGAARSRSRRDRGPTAVAPSAPRERPARSNRNRSRSRTRSGQPGRAARQPCRRRAAERRTRRGGVRRGSREPSSPASLAPACAAAAEPPPRPPEPTPADPTAAARLRA